MVSTVCAVLGILIAYSAFSILSSLRANIAAARQTDLRFVVTRECYSEFFGYELQSFSASEC
jgi:hypothetical protein